MSDTTFLGKIHIDDMEKELSAVYWPCIARLGWLLLTGSRGLGTYIENLLFLQFIWTSPMRQYFMWRDFPVKWIPTHYSLPPQLWPVVPMPLQVPLCDWFGSQLYTVSVVIIRVNVISFTCSVGSYLLLLPLAVDFLVEVLQYTVFWHQLQSWEVREQLHE